MFDHDSQTTLLLPADLSRPPDQQQVFPPLMSAYHERGYEMGYARGRSDVLAAILEATETFVRLDPDSAANTRRLLYAFSDFLEQQMSRRSPEVPHEFVDGLGI